MDNLIKITLPFALLMLLASGCVNRHGVSAKYYSDCKEYYDYQGYYHKDCGDDDIFTYEDVAELIERKKPEPKGNVW